MKVIICGSIGFLVFACIMAVTFLVVAVTFWVYEWIISRYRGIYERVHNGVSIVASIAFFTLLLTGFTFACYVIGESACHTYHFFGH